MLVVMVVTVTVVALVAVDVVVDVVVIVVVHYLQNSAVVVDESGSRLQYSLPHTMSLLQVFDDKFFDQPS